MGFTLIPNVFGSSRLCEDLKNFFAAACLVVDLCVEFSVGKGSGASLSELYVGRGIQFAALPVAVNVLRSLFNTPSPLQKDRPITVFRQHQRAEEAGRSGADHDRPRIHLLPSRRRKLIAGFFNNRYVPVSQLRGKFPLSLNPHLKICIHSVDIKELRFFPRVYGVLADPVSNSIPVLKLYGFSYLLFQIRLAVSAGKL